MDEDTIINEKPAKRFKGLKKMLRTIGVMSQIHIATFW